MQTHFNPYPHHLTDTIVCPRCGNCGVINWDYVPTPSGTKKDFAGIVGQFFERISKKAPYPIEIVCITCHIAVVAESLPP